MDNEEILLKAIEEHGGDDVIIPYRDIALLFPSSEPHPDSFEYKSIDEKSFLKWAKDNSFSVNKTPEQAPKGAENSPPIRF